MAIEAGQKVTGKVTGITKFGAFVSLPDNQSGLIHISEVADGFVKEVSDYLEVGEEVTVKVLKITPDGKINLSLRQAKEQSPNQPKPDTNKRTFAKPNPAPAPKRESRPTDDFDQMMSQFLKDSEDRLASLKRNTEGKRGGRGGRRG